MYFWKKLKKKNKEKIRSTILLILSSDEPYNKKLEGTILKGKKKNESVFGDNINFGGNVYLHADEKIEIGDNTIIGYGTIIHTSTHDPESNPVWSFRIDRPIKIGKDVWIGTGAIIMPGVIIEDYAIVGAGSIVNANVPERAIVAGNPAKIIRFRNKEIVTNRKIKNIKDSKIKKIKYLDKKIKKI